MLRIYAFLYQLVAGDFEPDLTFVLDIDPEIGLARSFKKAETMAIKETRNENRVMAWHQNLRRGYLEIAKSEPKRCVVLNADQSVEILHKDIVQVISERFGI